VRGLLHDLRARVVVLVDPVPEAHEARVLWLYRWPIFLADEERQGDWSWDFGASAAGANTMSRMG
jgi:hypothetical protein